MGEKAIIKTDKRNYGIDALRLFAMYLVVILHVLGDKGPLSVASGAAYAVCWLMEIIAFCAVNCFAIISGYVSYSDVEKPYRYSKYISMWLQVVFYCLGITLLVGVIRPDAVKMITLIKAAMPVSTNHYWYFTAYTGVFFIAPWLNKLVRSCSEREMNRLVLILFLLFSCYETLTRVFTPIFHLDNGYSFLWLAILYLIGAWMKKYAIAERIKTLSALLCIALCTLLTWAVKLIVKKDFLFCYVSPTILLNAMCVVALFSKLKFGGNGRKIIRCFAPAAFGVYLVHINQNAYYTFWQDSFAWIAQSPVWLIPIQVFGCAAGIFAASLLIEKLRLAFFRLLKINERAETLCESAGRRIAAILGKRIGL